MNPLVELFERQGQSPWLDNIRRSLITSGDLARLVTDDGLRGMTSNPSIFEKAIGGSDDYLGQLQELLGARDRDPGALYEALAVADVQAAADVLAGVYRDSGGTDGFVSLEVSPHLALDTEATVAEARRLWAEVGRPNLMVKVPATDEGIPAIATLIGEGINVNVTLLFAVQMYARAADAYMEGLERLAAAGGEIARVAGVASFFVSRIDTAVDRLIDRRTEAMPEGAARDALRALRGTTAVANAKVAYAHYRELVQGERWAALAARGARPQRLLWASTSTKDPSYRDVVYVEELIGPETVNTMPAATMEAFRDHGVVAPTLGHGLDEARQRLAALAGAGISLDEVTEQLRQDGVRLFADAFDGLLATVAQRRAGFVASRLPAERGEVPEPLDGAVDAALEDWRATGRVRRMWAGDAGVWTGADEASWLGWMHIVQEQRDHLDALLGFQREVRGAGFTHALLLGMGGSSLAPEVFRMTLGTAPGFPDLTVVDSTDPDQIRRAEAAVHLPTTLVFVSSKSGSTLEPNALMAYFWDRMCQAVGPEAAGRNFCAVTDPGSALQQEAAEKGFRWVHMGRPDIGGRYSALSAFGMAPAAAMGLDVARMLEQAELMVHSCAASVPPAENPGVRLGVLLGTAARAGRDKVTVVASPGLADVGAWLEQLIAESTGKQGRGLIPVDREPLVDADRYGADRVFAYLRDERAPDPAQDAAVDAVAAAGHPVVRIALADPHQVTAEMFRWEVATAVAGAVIGVNPFDQPDVEAAKVVARELMAAYERDGSLPAEEPLAEGDGLAVFAGGANRDALAAAAGGGPAGVLRAHLARVRAGDYVAFQAFVERSGEHDGPLQDARRAVLEATGVATTMGYGPRFLHSTGQAHKGGPDTGVFIQVTGGHDADLPVPGRSFTFGAVEAAQAAGDLAVLDERGRRALRVHVGGDPAAGLATLRDLVAAALPVRA